MTSGGPKPSGYRVRNRTRSYYAEVLKADATFIPDKMKTLEYEFTANDREFWAYWSTRGAYDGTYPHAGGGYGGGDGGGSFGGGSNKLLFNDGGELVLSGTTGELLLDD